LPLVLDCVLSVVMHIEREKQVECISGRGTEEDIWN